VLGESATRTPEQINVNVIMRSHWN